MEKIIVLGTGTASVIENFNTCFVLENSNDEPLDEKLYNDVKNIDYLLHEAFCLETESDKYKPREKNHDTVQSASIKAQNIGAKNLVLWHTQENLGKDRKGCYIKEAKENFTGNVYVPNDFEEIIL